MFARKLTIWRIDQAGARHLCPLAWIDSFAMRSHPGDAVLEDTLPVDDGLLEAGTRVSLDRLRTAMDDWFRQQGYLQSDERLQIEETGEEMH